jgi:hypothetical protein
LITVSSANPAQQKKDDPKLRRSWSSLYLYLFLSSVIKYFFTQQPHRQSSNKGSPATTVFAFSTALLPNLCHYFYIFRSTMSMNRFRCVCKKAFLVTVIALAIIAIPSLASRGTPFGSSPWMISPYSHSRSRRSNYFSSGRDVGISSLASRNEGKRQRQQQLISHTHVAREELPSTVSEFPDLSYRDLGPIGKTIAGVTEIVFATAFEYCSGFLTGLVFGTLVGLPGFVFRPTELGARQAFSMEIRNRFARMNTRSMSWAKNFGSISAAFGGFGVAVKVLRNGEEDVWNQILSSAAAGAFFARKGTV